MRTKVEWRSSCKDNYNNFCKKHPSLEVSYDQWKNIIYSFNESFKEHILQTGEKAKLPFGLGEFTINKKKRKKIVKDINGVEHIGLPVDWVKTKQKGKLIYNFNFHTEGYFFGWMWFKKTARFKHANLWYFKPCRSTSRLLAHYIKTNNECLNTYHQWTNYNT